MMVPALKQLIMHNAKYLKNDYCIPAFYQLYQQEQHQSRFDWPPELPLSQRLQDLFRTLSQI